MNKLIKKLIRKIFIYSGIYEEFNLSIKDMYASIFNLGRELKKAEEKLDKDDQDIIQELRRTEELAHSIKEHLNLETYFEEIPDPRCGPPPRPRTVRVLRLKKRAK